MTTQNTTCDPKDDGEQANENDNACSTKVIPETRILPRRKRSIVSVADKKRGGGGMDSLGQGNLP